MANIGVLLIVMETFLQFTPSKVLGMYIQYVVLKLSRINKSGFLHFNVCVCDWVMHMMAPLSNLKPGLRAHLSVVVDRRGLAARRSIHFYC